jgi:hypothetical protein
VKVIVVEGSFDLGQHHQAHEHTGGQPNDVDHREQAVFPPVAKGDFEVIAKHRRIN